VLGVPNCVGHFLAGSFVADTLSFPTLVTLFFARVPHDGHDLADGETRLPRRHKTQIVTPAEPSPSLSPALAGKLFD